MAARAKADHNPRVAELYRRMAEDQFSRVDSLDLRPFLGPGIHTTSEQCLSEASLVDVATSIQPERCEVTHANTAWLKADLRAHGWYQISVDGADADRAAWSMVMHAQNDLAFREEVLAMLQPLWESGETKGENFASLYDDVASARGRPGRFGLLGECTAPGVWMPAPQETTKTEEWRAKAGMTPLSKEITARSRGCGS